MKDLLILRHAKSRSATPDMADFTRDLSRRGRDDAAAMANWLKDKITPQLVLCSPARRTRQTVELMATWLAGVPIEEDRELYLADAATILRRLAKVSASVDRVVIVGHNPGLQDLAISLTPAGGAARMHLTAKFPTCALAWFQCDAGSWSIAPSHARLRHFISPSNLA